MIKKIALFIVVSLFYKSAHAQLVTDSTANADSAKRSPLKTLTYRQYEALLKGEDLYNMAAAGQLNHFPLPGKVLLFKNELDLGPVQVSKITAINTGLHRKLLEMGPIIIHNEQVIDSLFRTRHLNEGSIIFYTNRYGLYQGELRNTILQACYATERLLSAGQIKQLEVLESHK